MTSAREAPSAQVCTRCGGIGTHYLTCPRLRLPEGYRIGEDPRPPRCMCGLEVGACGVCA